jgi:hypothetical protein
MGTRNRTSGLYGKQETYWPTKQLLFPQEYLRLIELIEDGLILYLSACSVEPICFVKFLKILIFVWDLTSCKYVHSTVHAKRWGKSRVWVKWKFRCSWLERHVIWLGWNVILFDVWKEPIDTSIFSQSKNRLHILSFFTLKKKAVATISVKVGANSCNIPEHLRILLILSLVKCQANDRMSTL